MSELPNYKCYLSQLPATILNLLGLEYPSFLGEPVHDIVENFTGIERIIINLIDNFGLFEITYHKPQFIITNSDALVLLSTKNPYTLGFLHQVMYGGFEKEPNGFHLLKEINNQGKKTIFVGRKKDIDRYDGGTNSIPKETDMSSWIEAAKVVNRFDLSWIHYLDFEALHRQHSKLRQQTPETLLEKLINRTDKWILSTYKQLRNNSLLVILGDHGRYRMDLEYSGKIAQWRQASVPIAILIKK